MKDLNLFKVKGSIYLREVSSKAELVGDCDGYLVRSSEKIARGIIASLKDKKFVGKVGIYGGDDAFNRRVVESLKIDYLVSVEALTGYDSLKQRDSGLNHVVARMAAEKGIKVVVDFGEIGRLMSQVAGGRLQVAGRKEAAGRIVRVMQNVRVCRKVGCGVLIASLGREKNGVVDVKGRQAFGVGLGMSSGEVRDCVGF